MKGPQMKTIQKTTALFLATTLTVSAALAFDVNKVSPGYEAEEAQAENRSVTPKKAVIKGPVKKLNEVQQVTAPDAELKATFDTMTEEIVRVQAIYDAGQYGQALSESKKLLDTVRMRTGIHPKAKITEKIAIKDVFDQSEMAVVFKRLNQTQKEKIILAVLNHRGGLYLDILNQTKRISLIYLKSLYMRLKQDGPLLNEDIQKIKTDLLSIMTIKIELIQYAPEVQFVIKENDVAISDQNYLFTREIKIFAISHKEFGLTEQSFEEVSEPKFDIEKCIKSISGLNSHHSIIGWWRFKPKDMSYFCSYYEPKEIACALNLYVDNDFRHFLKPNIEMCSGKEFILQEKY